MERKEIIDFVFRHVESKKGGTVEKLEPTVGIPNDFIMNQFDGMKFIFILKSFNISVVIHESKWDNNKNESLIHIAIL